MKSLQLGILGVKHLFYRPFLRRVPGEKQRVFPYVAQWESKTLIKKIIAKKISAEDDPLWKKSGAASKKEYLNWSWNACGMACFRMILLKVKKYEEVPPVVSLGKLCMKYGGYRVNESAYDQKDTAHAIDGLFYHPFVAFAKKEFAMNCESASYLTIAEILLALADGNSIIASVSPAIRDLSKPQSVGGHLILLTGYNFKEKLLFFHNPSGTETSSQQNVTISFSDFSDYFAYRGIIIYGK